MKILNITKRHKIGIKGLFVFYLQQFLETNLNVELSISQLKRIESLFKLCKVRYYSQRYTIGNIFVAKCEYFFFSMRGGKKQRKKETDLFLYINQIQFVHLASDKKTWNRKHVAPALVKKEMM